jgi:multicomponent Na+:H+ antiporter subunit D
MDHGEAPWPMVLALSTTAGLTLALFFFHGPVLALAQSLTEVRP